MKKLITVFFAILLLWGCTGEKKPEEPVTNGNKETEPEKETVFPYEEVTGYWIIQDGGEYFRIYQKDDGLYCFEEGDFKDYTSGEIVPTGCEEDGKQEFVFKTYYKDMNDLARDIRIDLNYLEQDCIVIDGTYYARVGTDRAQAKLANDWYIKKNFTETFSGYWNGGFNRFVYIGQSEEDCVMTFGLYDSEPGPGWIIDTIDKDKTTGIYMALLIDQMTHSSISEHTFDVSGADNGEIRIDGELYHFAGEDFNAAYNDYSKNLN
ncbi:MAG: hypothetical protein IKF68_00295 [Erysipelotrichaceae bacterium]|nr:hypothetical protein [Erysipelotrichaceae bacterium]